MAFWGLLFDDDDNQITDWIELDAKDWRDAVGEMYWKVIEEIPRRDVEKAKTIQVVRT